MIIIKLNYTSVSPVIKITFDETPIYVKTSVNNIYAKVVYGTGGGGIASVEWGGITGTLSNQLDLQAALDAKQDDITLTTIGSSGAATFISNVLNIPQYSGNPGTVTSVGLSMPSAFNVTNSPITTSGTIGVTGAGLATQYIRGDGQLATFPSTASGGSSVNYYLNGSISASVAGYKQMDNIAIVGGGTDFTLTGNGLIAQFLTDVGNPNRVSIPGGAWNFEMYFQVSSSGGNQKFYIELHKYNGTTFTLIASSSLVPEEITGGTNIDLYLTSLAVPTTTLLTTDRLAIRVYIVDNAVGRTITLHTENTTLCEIITTFAGGVSSLNGLTANTQYLAVGTSGTDFNINSVSDTHTFNLPTASATNRGALSTADWSTFNSKVGGTGANGQIAYWNGTSTQTGTNSLIYSSAVLGGGGTYNQIYLRSGSANGGAAIAINTSISTAAGSFGMYDLSNSNGAGLGLISYSSSFPLFFRYAPGGVTSFDWISMNSTYLSLDKNNSVPVLVGTSIASIYKFDVNGTTRLNGVTTIGAINNATIDTDRFLVSDTGVIKYRTGTELLSDIGGQSALTNPITGTGVNGQVAYWSGANTQAGSNNLFWDNANGRLGIGTNAPVYALDVIGNSRFQNDLFIRGTLNPYTATNRGAINLNGSADNIIAFTNNISATAYIFSSNAQFEFNNISNSNIVFKTNNNTKVVISASGDLLVGGGTYSPYNSTNRANITLQGSTSNILAFTNGTNAGRAWLFHDGTNLELNNLTNGYFTLATNNTSFARLFATGNLLLQNGGTFTDGGQRLQVQGTTLLNGSTTISGSTTASGGVARNLVNPTLVAAANNDVLVGLDVNPTFTLGAFTGTISLGLRVLNNVSFGAVGTGLFWNNLNSRLGIGVSNPTEKLQIDNGNIVLVNGKYRLYNTAYGKYIDQSYATNGYEIDIEAVKYLTIFRTTGNLLLQNGGTFTDAGYRLDVNGTARVKGKLSLTAGTTAASQINLASSTTPTTPVDGDIWFDGTDLKMRIGGVTKTFTLI